MSELCQQARSNGNRNLMRSNVNRLFIAGALAVWVVAGSQAGAQLPPDFPHVSIVPNTNPAPGDFFGTLSVNGVPGFSNYFAILDNASNPILLSKTNSLGNLACNGLFVSTAGTNGQSVQFLLKDSTFNVVATNQAGNGYTADNHDFELLPNGHALVLIYDSTPVVDMSKLVTGGFPAARLTQSVIQELDGYGEVVFQWRSLDHIPVTDSYQNLTNANVGDYIQVNSVWFDDTDGNLIHNRGHRYHRPTRQLQLRLHTRDLIGIRITVRHDDVLHRFDRKHAIAILRHQRRLFGDEARQRGVAGRICCRDR